MSRIRKVCGALFVALVLLSASSAAAQEATPAEPTTPDRPNVVFVLTDDMAKGDLRFMPKLGQLVRNQGVSFENYHVTTPTCCPSRATTFRGQYAHNTGLWSNYSPHGGAGRFRELGLDQSTLATWLHDTGYRTGFVGKYLNQYDGTYVPPGWDYWRALHEGFWKDLKLTEDGEAVDYPEEIVTDELLGEKAREFVSSASGAPEPFFLMLATHAPHRPAEYAPGYENLYPSTMRHPRSPSYEERDISDKPGWIKKARAVYDDSKVNWDGVYRGRAKSLRVVDDQVASLIETLRAEGELENTYIVFASDNGFHFGDHGLWSKGTAYTEALKVPLVVRGPGITPGSTEKRLAINTDLGPTFSDLAEAETPSWVDGRSFAPLLHGESTTWRQRFLYESRADAGFYIPTYAGVKTAGWSYTRYSTGAQEYYNLNTDPYQLRSLHKTAKAKVAAARRQLVGLMNCTGDGCRAAEGR